MPPLSHLTCKPIQSNRYLVSSLGPHIPHAESHGPFPLLTHTTEPAHVWGFVKQFTTWQFLWLFLHLIQSPSWRTTLCQLSVTAYSIYSQLPSILATIPPSAALGHAMPWWQGPPTSTGQILPYFQGKCICPYLRQPPKNQMSTKKKYSTINFLCLIHRVWQILSTFNNQCHCLHVHS